MVPYIGQIMLFAGNFAPTGWAFCNGQAMNIASNEALFSILGTSYGGDGRLTFNLPNIQFIQEPNYDKNIVVSNLTEVKISTSEINTENYSQKLQVKISNQINSANVNQESIMNIRQKPVSTFLIYCIAVKGLFPSNI